MNNPEIDPVSQMIARGYERKINRLYQEKTHFSNNINIFLISQSMFILAYITVLSIEKASYLNWVFGVIGCIVACLFLIAFYDQSNNLLKFIEEMEEEYDSFKEPNKYFLKLFGLALPIIFIVIWIVFIGFYFTL